MWVLLLGMLICVGLAVVVILTVASPSFREGDKLLTPAGEEQVEALKKRAANLSAGAESRIRNVVLRDAADVDEPSPPAEGALPDDDDTRAVDTVTAPQSPFARAQAPEKAAQSESTQSESAQSESARSTPQQIAWDDEEDDDWARDEWGRTEPAPSATPRQAAASATAEPSATVEPPQPKVEAAPVDPEPDEAPDTVVVDLTKVERANAEGTTAERPVAEPVDAMHTPAVEPQSQEPELEPEPEKTEPGLGTGAKVAIGAVGGGVAAKMSSLMNRRRPQATEADASTEETGASETSAAVTTVTSVAEPELRVERDPQVERSNQPEAKASEPQERTAPSAEDATPVENLDEPEAPKTDRPGFLARLGNSVQHAGADTNQIGPRHAKP